MTAEQIDQRKMMRLLAVMSISTVMIALLASAIGSIGTAFVFPVVIAAVLFMVVAVIVWFVRLWRIGRIDVRDQKLVSVEYKPMLRIIGILRASLGFAGMFLLVGVLIALVVGVGRAAVFNAFLYVTAAMYFNLSIGSALANIAIICSASDAHEHPH